jgi:hypothetical protein
VSSAIRIHTTGHSADANVARRSDDEMACHAWSKSGFPLQWTCESGRINGQSTGQGGNMTFTRDHLFIGHRWVEPEGGAALP